jgi:hypothetical protein
MASTLDYIFMRKNEYFRKNGCHIQEYLNPTKDLLNDVETNPSLSHPSDHYAIGYTVLLQHPEFELSERVVFADQIKRDGYESLENRIRYQETVASILNLDADMTFEFTNLTTKHFLETGFS